jgi:hypothetical protein
LAIDFRRRVECGEVGEYLDAAVEAIESASYLVVEMLAVCLDAKSVWRWPFNQVLAWW